MISTPVKSVRCGHSGSELASLRELEGSLHGQGWLQGCDGQWLLARDCVGRVFRHPIGCWSGLAVGCSCMHAWLHIGKKSGENNEFSDSET